MSKCSLYDVNCSQMRTFNNLRKYVLFPKGTSVHNICLNNFEYSYDFCFIKQIEITSTSTNKTNNNRNFKKI